MSNEEIEAIATRLQELSEQLADEELPGEVAEKLAREAAELAAQGSAAVERAARELSERGVSEDE